MEAPEHFIAGGYYGYNAADFPQKPGEHFTVDDLLDLPNEAAAMSDGLCDNVLANSTDSSNFTVVDSCNSSISGGESYFSGGFGARSFGDSNFATELCVPNDDVAELEWLSNFVEDSLSFSNTAQNLQLQYSLNLVPGSKPSGPESSHPGTGPAPHSFLPETPLPSKSRSRRSRAAPCDWTTRLLHLNSKPPKAVSVSDSGENPNQEAVARRCLHCAAEKTPQWRTGPMGPKTLCNACGVRFKSGRLVPEYRPAASPTFMSTKHSNSHRKVLELRRQKEMHRVAQQHQQMLCQRSIVGVSNGYDDCLINHGGGSTYSHLI